MVLVRKGGRSSLSGCVQFSRSRPRCFNYDPFRTHLLLKVIPEPQGHSAWWDRVRREDVWANNSNPSTWQCLVTPVVESFRLSTCFRNQYSNLSRARIISSIDDVSFELASYGLGWLV